MIKPDMLQRLFETCDDSKWVGDIVRALGGQDIDLDFGQRQTLTLIEAELDRFETSTTEKRERWARVARDKRERDKAKNGGDDTRPSSKVAMTNDDKRASSKVIKTNDDLDINQPTNHPTNQPTNVRESKERDALTHSLTPFRVRPSEAEVVEHAKSQGIVPPWYAKWWYRQMVGQDWQTTKGGRIDSSNIYGMLATWWRNSSPEERESVRAEVEAAAPKPRREYTLQDWAQCAERCGNFVNGRCRAGAIIPPRLQERPIQPRECPAYKRKEDD